VPAVDFGPWEPDRADIGQPLHLYTAKNCVPVSDHYHPLQTLTATTGALTARCIGVIAVRDIDNAAHMYAGDATKLYELEAGTWTDRSKVGGYTTATSTTRWRFATFGDRVIATNALDPIQYIDASTAATAFADLGGSPGLAKYIATYGEFVFLGALGTNGMSIKWSAIGNSAGWTAGVNLSDEQEFADGGNITGFAATQAALYVFQEKCIRRILFVGGDVIMQIDKLVEKIGCIEPNSLVQYGQVCFFLDEDGWYMWDFQSQPVPIGHEKFDDWFIEDSERTSWPYMSVVVDPRQRVFAAGYVSTGNATTLPDRVLFFNYQLGRASYADVSHEILAPAIALGVTLDDLTGDLDNDYSISFDDPYYQGGAFYFGAFTSAHRLGSFSGANMEATFQTSEQALYPSRRTGIQWIKPLTDASGATAAAGSKVKPSDAISFQSQVAQQASGRCPQRGADGFYHAVKVVIPSGETWTYARGFEFEPAKARGVR
jgi:hypothetical protein